MLVFSKVFYVSWKAINEIREILKAKGVSAVPSPTICTFEIEWHKVCYPTAIKQSTKILACRAIIGSRFEKRKMLVLGGTILKKGKFQSKYIVSLT